MSQADKMKQGQLTNPETPGYVGFANLPNQVHRKSVKKGFEFTLMVVGESGLGKSTLINSLFLTDLYPERVIPGAAEKIERTVQIEASTVEIEERGVKLRLTVVDTPGYGDAINSQDCIPFAVVGSNQQIEAKGKKVRGRLYPWGVVEVENPEHNDFLKLRTMLITHMQDLQEVTQDLHYENFRSERLKRGGRKGPEPEEMDKDIILQEKEAELRRMQEMIVKMQAQMQKQGDGDSPHL
ncbi:septin-2-like [Sinocyclocheilus anshuiensis]|uniref:septin-2-like n=1 Tax=Sinocyclocheilus anshuiensis TaxID=1608454 RepID=UPI0007BA0FD3|nr:PREDICTED: septin-2-like [Sinocyclocheilus anshuiensis]